MEGRKKIQTGNTNTKISLSFNDQKGKKGNKYANCITKELVSLQKTKF